MSESQRERVEKLIALALNNPSAHEAASAALAACRLIREHKLLAPSSVACQPFQADYRPVYQSQPPAGYNYQPEWYTSPEDQSEFARDFEFYMKQRGQS